MRKRCASDVSACTNGPSSDSAAANQSSPIVGVKYAEYSGKTTKLAPRSAARSASSVTVAMFSSRSPLGANWATATVEAEVMTPAYDPPATVNREPAQKRLGAALSNLLAIRQQRGLQANTQHTHEAVVAVVADCSLLREVSLKDADVVIRHEPQQTIG